MRKYNLVYVRESFRSEGYKLLSNDEYLNGKQKFRYICPQGHEHCISFDKWLEKRRCPYCDGQGKPSIAFVRSEFLKEGYILLSKKYNNSRTRLYYICSVGHKHYITWNNWHNGQRCPYCSGKYVSEDRIMKFFNSKGYEVININGKGYRAEITYKCPFNHIHTTRFNSKHRLGCPTCAYIKKSGPGNSNWKGGISCEPYCDVWADKEYKESIKERDNYTCQNPDCWGTSKRLTIHHIDYVKKNCSPYNLITLCNSCNSRANKDRDYWQKVYNEIVEKKEMKFGGGWRRNK